MLHSRTSIHPYHTSCPQYQQSLPQTSSHHLSRQWRCQWRKKLPDDPLVAEPVFSVKAPLTPLLPSAYEKSNLKMLLNFRRWTETAPPVTVEEPPLETSTEPPFPCCFSTPRMIPPQLPVAAPLLIVSQRLRYLLYLLQKSMHHSRRFLQHLRCGAQ